MNEYMGSAGRYKHIWNNTVEYPLKLIPKENCQPYLFGRQQAIPGNNVWSSIEKSDLSWTSPRMVQKIQNFNIRKHRVSRKSAVFIESVLRFCQKIWYLVPEVRHFLENKCGSTRLFISKSSNLLRNIRPQGYVWELSQNIVGSQCLLSCSPSG